MYVHRVSGYRAPRNDDRHWSEVFSTR